MSAKFEEFRYKKSTDRLPPPKRTDQAAVVGCDWLELLAPEICTEIFKHFDVRQLAGLCKLSHTLHSVAKPLQKVALKLSDSQFHVFRAVLERNESVLILGPPGCGKSHLLRVLVSLCNARDTLVCASTGAAAERIHGATLHSKLKLGVGQKSTAQIVKDLQRSRGVISNVKRLVIDEVSMLTAATLDQSVDVLCRATGRVKAPQLVLVGDPLQLQAVDAEKDGVFYDASIMESVRAYVLTESFRQHESSEFLKILNRARIGRATNSDVEFLNEKSRPQADTAIRLFCTTRETESYNVECMNALATPVKIFIAIDLGSRNNLPLSHLALNAVHLKVGARVVLTRNSQEVSALVNGSLGTVTGFGSDQVYVRFDNGLSYPIKRVCYQAPAEPKIPNATNATNATESAPAAFTIDSPARYQIPLAIAFAVSIHKAQGATLDTAVLDLTNSFVPGHAYVALSRVRSIETLELRGLNLGKLNKVSVPAKRFYGDCRDCSADHIEELERKHALFDAPPPLELSDEALNAMMDAFESA